MLEIQRHKPVMFEPLENSPWKSAPVPSSHHSNNSDNEEETMPQMYTIADDMKENEISVDEDMMISGNPEIAQLATSTPLPLLARGHRVCFSNNYCIYKILTLVLSEWPKLYGVLPF